MLNILEKFDEQWNGKWYFQNIGVPTEIKAFIKSEVEGIVLEIAKQSTYGTVDMESLKKVFNNHGFNIK